MRASRLLRILLLLQNRGRMTCAALAEELEVAPRTILRDLDALTEAGLPVIAHRGWRGGVELDFEYRTRLTGLAADEAEALGVLLARPAPELAALGLGDAAARAAAKLFEAFPDQTRARLRAGRAWFRLDPPADTALEDPRIPALAEAVRGARIVRLQARSSRPQKAHPIGLDCGEEGWSLRCALAEAPINRRDWGDINISVKTFAG